MAKISTYVINTIPTSSDILIGTNVDLSNETKNFSIGSILSLISAGSIGPQGLTGAQGDQGIQGLTGPQGATGLQGSQGIQGAQGPQGPTGFEGAQGPQGDPGATGATGPQGIEGLIGAIGPQGDPGIQGLTGAQGISNVQGIQGEQGIQGLTGAQGLPGDTGATGPQGPDGDQGIQGEIGSAGLTWQGLYNLNNIYDVNDAVGFGGSSYYNISGCGPCSGDPSTNTTNWALIANQGLAGSTGAQGSIGLTGAQGSIGPQGNPGIQGVQGPQGDQGNPGPTGLTGPQGIQGDQGIQGPQGIQGDQGIQGPQGIQGVTGAVGTQGNQGPIGPTSTIAGPQGPIGPQGIQGLTGATGAQGAQGNQGIQGETGPQGIQGASNKSNIGRFYNGGYIVAEWVQQTSTNPLTFENKVLIVLNPGYSNNPSFLKSWSIDYGLTQNVPNFGASYISMQNIANGSIPTTNIVNQMSSTPGDFAAKSAFNLVANGKNDWYLPSITELILIGNQITWMGSIPTGLFWSSTEYGNNSAFVLNMTTKQVGVVVKSSLRRFFVVRTDTI